MVLTMEKCSICFNYWTSHGNYMAGYQYLIHDQHIPEAHATSPPPPPTHPHPPPPPPTHPEHSVSDLLSKLHHANAKAKSLKHQLDEAHSKSHHLQTQLDHAKAQITKLHSELAAANAKVKDLHKHLEDCKKEKKALDDEVAKLKTEKVNLEHVNKTLSDELTKKDVDIQKYYADKLAAENKISTKLEPYIKQLIDFMKARNITGYPSGP